MKNFDGATLELAFKSDIVLKIFETSHRSIFEKEVAKISRRQIKVLASVEKNLSEAKLFNLNNAEEKFLDTSKNVFQTEKIIPMKSEE